MIEVDLNGTRYNASDMNPGWLNEQIRRREDNGVSVCLRVCINRDDVSLSLSWGDCGKASGGRKPSSEEQGVLAIWNKLDCGTGPINPGKLIAFLNQIQ